MQRTREQIREGRRQLKQDYGELFGSVAAILLRADPIGIGFDNENTDEYEPEAGTILPRLKDCSSYEDVLRIVHEEFVRWFDADTAGSAESYRKAAAEIWHLWIQRPRQ